MRTQQNPATSFAIGGTKFQPAAGEEFEREVDLLRRNLEPFLRALPLKGDQPEQTVHQAALELAIVVVFATEVELAYDASSSVASRELEHLAKSLERSAHLVEELSSSARRALCTATMAQWTAGSQSPDWSDLEPLSRIARASCELVIRRQRLALATKAAELFVQLTGKMPPVSGHGPYFRLIDQLFAMVGVRAKGTSTNFGRRAARKVREKDCE